MSRWVLSALALALLSGCGENPVAAPCAWTTPEGYFSATDCRDHVFSAGDRDALVCRDLAPHGRLPRVAAGVTGEIRLWLELRNESELDEEDPGIRGVLVSGTDCTPIEPPRCSSGSVYDMVVVAAGDDYEAVWIGDRSTYRAIIDGRTGSLIACGRLSGGSSALPSLAWRVEPDYRVLVRFPGEEPGAPAILEVFDAAGMLMHTESAGSVGTQADAAIGGGAIAFVWGSGDDSPGGLRLIDATKQGHPTIMERSFAAPAFLYPRVAWDGSGFLVVWWQNGQPPQLRGARFDSTGSELVPATSLGNGLMPRLAASDGTARIAYVDEEPSSGYCLPVLRSANVDAAVLSVGERTTVGTPGESEPLYGHAVSVTGDGFIVAAPAEVWYTSGPDSYLECQSPLFLAFNRDGRVAGEAEIVGGACPEERDASDGTY